LHKPRSLQGALDTTLCDQVCLWLTAGWWFSLGIPGSFTNKTDFHDITEILLKVALNTIYRENHQPAVSHRQTWSHNVVSSAPCNERGSNSQL
jgi:hypothetical protein